MSTDNITTSRGSSITSGRRPAFGNPKPVITVGLTTFPLSVMEVMYEGKDPHASAIVFFAGIYLTDKIYFISASQCPVD
ncbi:hypothetical protein BDZ91DRAFT_718975 [Kalaharituber pfeilii]|nr:hypothetical protein BDZ91DRAFT_718975 [Kalaharituber pfeilii]